MRLVDADALKDCIMCADATKHGNKTVEQLHNSYSTLMRYEIAGYIDDMRTVDAEPVRHGEWKQCFEDWRQQIDGDECSACGFRHYGCGISHYKYCPNCGAKMDGGKQDV